MYERRGDHLIILRTQHKDISRPSEIYIDSKSPLGSFKQQVTSPSGTLKRFAVKDCKVVNLNLHPDLNSFYVGGANFMRCE